MSASLRVLLVDDDREVLTFLCRMLEEHGARPTAVAGVAAAREELARHPQGHFDVILLDVMMPDGTGWDLLRELRGGGDDTPIIFVTSSQEVEDRVRGLRLGADDYVLKPFTAVELLARLDAVVRRRRSLPVLVHADLRVSLADRKVERAGKPVALSPTEFEVLRVLMEARGEPVSRTVLLREVWGIDFDPGTTIIEVQITRLRKKVDRKGKLLIHTIPGVGYRLGESRPDAAPPATGSSGRRQGETD